MSRECQHCNGEITGKPVAGFCSQKCYHSNRAKGRLEYFRQYKAANPEKQRSHAIVRSERKRLNPQSCEWCDKQTTKLIGHHNDYDKPLAINWVCHSCHRKHHAQLDKSAALMTALQPVKRKRGRPPKIAVLSA